MLGVVELVNPRGGHPFDAADQRTLEALADYAAIAIDNARAYERIRELTLRDEHTGLFNSRHLWRQLELEVARTARTGRPFSLVFVDLDHFKQVNDRFGHQAGSAVLLEVGELIRDLHPHHRRPGALRRRRVRGAPARRPTGPTPAGSAERIRVAMEEALFLRVERARRDGHGELRARHLPGRRGHRREGGPGGRRRHVPRQGVDAERGGGGRRLTGRAGRLLPVLHGHGAAQDRVVHLDLGAVAQRLQPGRLHLGLAAGAEAGGDLRRAAGRRGRGRGAGAPSPGPPPGRPAWRRRPGRVCPAAVAAAAAA